MKHQCNLHSFLGGQNHGRFKDANQIFNTYTNKLISKFTHCKTKINIFKQ